MQIDIIVEARMTSTRLPGKVMLPCLGKPLLEVMIERLKKVDLVDRIIVATTINQSDNCIEELTKQQSVECYRGCEDDVLLRVLETAKKFETDLIVEITGDDPLVDPEISSEVVKCFVANYDRYELVANDIVTTVPLGFYTRAFKRNTLEKIEKATNHPFDRENPEAYFYNNLKKFTHCNIKLSPFYKRDDIRLTMDTIEDYEVIKNVYEALYPYDQFFTLLDIIHFLDNNPAIKNLNISVQQKSFQYG